MTMIIKEHPNCDKISYAHYSANYTFAAGAIEFSTTENGASTCLG